MQKKRNANPTIKKPTKSFHMIQPPKNTYIYAIYIKNDELIKKNSTKAQNRKSKTSKLYTRRETCKVENPGHSVVSSINFIPPLVRNTIIFISNQL